MSPLAPMLSLALACTSVAPSPAPSAEASIVPLLDATAWLAQLQAARPELVAQHAGRIDDPGWQALVIRPQYHDELLSSSEATYATLVAREYSAAERDLDLDWAQQLRDAQNALLPTPTLRAAGYPLTAYVGYRVGPDAGLLAEKGLTYKVFFELSDFQTALGPERYLGFSKALERAGFVGDSKIDLRPGQVRFQYNNVIVHAPSLALAECAEATGLAYFAGALLHVARGVDVWERGRGLDWHHFLLTGRFERLPAEVRAFVHHDSPLPGAPCPRSAGR